MEYRPSPSVTTLRVFSINTGLAASTVTPGRIAPDESFTSPAIVLCAAATEGRSVSSARAAQMRATATPLMAFSLAMARRRDDSAGTTSQRELNHLSQQSLRRRVRQDERSVR